jgi:hypothetical protein
MSPLKIEACPEGSNDWRPLANINLGDKDGTVSDNHTEGRDIYLFGINPLENEGYIKKSKAGIDAADPSIRVVSSDGFETVKTLDPDESYELTVTPDRQTRAITFRFTYLDI